MKKLAKIALTWNLKIGILSSMIALPAMAQQVFKSSSARVHLLELYSTQSCSSCPPAQEWVSNLKSSPQLWKTFVPIVFHVDYWDYLGWKDPYSSKTFSQRQISYATELGSTPRTPMFIIDGKDSPRPSKGSLLKLNRKVGTLTAVRLKNNKYQVRFDPQVTIQRSLSVNFAVLGSGIQTQVTAGENNGSRLAHDFLTLSMGKSRLHKRQGYYTAQILIDPTKTQPAPHKAVVFWINEGQSLKPLQVAGGPLKE